MGFWVELEPHHHAQGKEGNPSHMQLIFRDGKPLTEDPPFDVEPFGKKERRKSTCG